MSIDKKIFAIVILLLISCFTGCTLLNRTEFSLLSLNIEDDDGFVTMSISFNISDKITLELIGPNSDILFSDEFYRGSHNALAYLDEYMETPPPGKYILKAYDKNDNVIFKKKLFYEDQLLSIIDISEKWWIENNKYSLVGLSITLQNQGELPVYPYIAEVQIYNKVTSGFFIPTIILPTQIKTANCFVYIDDIPLLNHLLELSLTDIEENTIVDTSINVFPSENVSEITFRWKYKGSHSLVLPDIKFLYDHYSSLERLGSEDYAAYVFDKYDDQYIDLIAKRLLSLSDSSKDVEIINFVASFVQDLKYVEDDLDCDYPRYPIESLKDARGDCEDNAILAVSILDSIGYNVSLIKIPNHVAAGVHLGKSVTAFDYYIDEYYYLETTGSGWILGNIPPEHQDQSNISVYHISTRPLLIHSWINATRFSSTDGEDYVELKIIVENLGRKSAGNFKIWGAFFNQNNYFNFKETSKYSITAGTKKILELKLDVPQSIITKLKTHIFLNNKIVHERESSSNFP